MAERCARFCGGPDFDRWFAEPRIKTWIRRLARNDLEQCRLLLTRLLEVLERIPLKVPMSLTQLAAETCGDSHALDRDSSLGRLIARALAALQSQSPARSAAEIRTLWANVGVVLDELSATVLVLNLSALPGSALGDMLYALRQAGEPARLTFRQLRGNAPCDFDVAGASEVFVCENPAVVAAAADRWGADSRPLICVEGQPNLAAERLLQMLVERGVSLRYHGDFDWGGIRIAAHLWKRFRFTPWRFTCDDYVQAPPGRTLSGQPIATPWDDRLGLAMQAAAVIVHEEALLEQLLADLGPAAHVAGPRMNLEVTRASQRRRGAALTARFELIKFLLDSGFRQVNTCQARSSVRCLNRINPQTSGKFAAQKKQSGRLDTN